MDVTYWKPTKIDSALDITLRVTMERRRDSEILFVTSGRTANRGSLTPGPAVSSKQARNSL